MMDEKDHVIESLNAEIATLRAKILELGNDNVALDWRFSRELSIVVQLATTVNEQEAELALLRGKVTSMGDTIREMTCDMLDRDETIACNRRTIESNEERIKNLIETNLILSDRLEEKVNQ